MYFQVVEYLECISYLWKRSRKKTFLLYSCEPLSYVCCSCVKLPREKARAGLPRYQMQEFFDTQFSGYSLAQNTMET